MEAKENKVRESGDSIPNVYFSFFLIRYPGTLDVTVKGIKPIASYKEPASRPMNVLQEDRLNELSSSIQTLAVLVDEKLDHQHTVTSNLSAETTNHWKDLCSQWKRQPGQVSRTSKCLISHKNLLIFNRASSIAKSLTRLSETAKQLHQRVV